MVLLWSSTVCDHDCLCDSILLWCERVLQVLTATSKYESEQYYWEWGVNKVIKCVDDQMLLVCSRYLGEMVCERYCMIIDYCIHLLRVLVVSGERYYACLIL